MTRQKALLTVQRLREVLGARNWSEAEKARYTEAAAVLR